MKHTHEAPKLPKLPFFAADLVLIATAVLIAWRSATPLSTVPLLAITLCALVGITLTVIPFLADYARRQDAELTERQHQIAALARTTSDSAEQLSIAAAGLNDLAAASKQNLDSINQLPGLLQKRIDTLTQQLATVTPAPAAPSSVKDDVVRLEAAVEKITRSLAKLEAAAKTKTDDLAATEKQLAASEKDLAASLARATTQLAAFAATATTAVAAAERLASIPAPATPAPAPVAAQTPPPSPSRASRNKSAPPPAPVVTQPAQVPELPAPVVETPPPAPAEDIPAVPRSEVAPEPAAPVAEPPPAAEPAPTASEPIAPEPVVPPSSPEPAPAPVLAPAPELVSPPAAGSEPDAEVFTASSPDPDEVPVSEPEAPKIPRARKPKTDDSGFDLGLVSEAPDATESSLSSDGFTRLIATAYIGIGNKLYIRGEGPGLSWEKGVPLQFVSIGKWRWETPDATAPVKAKLYKNDQTECLGLGTLTLDPGRQHEVNAGF